MPQFEEQQNLEIIYVARNRTPENSFIKFNLQWEKHFVKEMHGDWLMTEHESDLSKQLDEKFDIIGGCTRVLDSPTLVVLKKDGTLVTKKGFQDVMTHGKRVCDIWNA